MFCFPQATIPLLTDRGDFERPWLSDTSHQLVCENILQKNRRPLDANHQNIYLSPLHHCAVTGTRPQGETKKHILCILIISVEEKITNYKCILTCQSRVFRERLHYLMLYIVDISQ